MIPHLFRGILLLGVVLNVACTELDGEEASSPAGSRAALESGHVDSIIPIDEALRRFQADLDPVTELSEASPSRDSLVRRFVRAVEANDSASIRSMVLTRAEFAYLYFPTTQYTSKPYEMEPALLWFLTQQNSEKGIKRMIRRFGGKELSYDRHTCEAEPTVEGANRLWQRCEVIARAIAPDGSALRLFGTILERDGQFKFISYTNEF